MYLTFLVERQQLYVSLFLENACSTSDTVEHSGENFRNTARGIIYFRGQPPRENHYQPAKRRLTMTIIKIISSILATDMKNYILVYTNFLTSLMILT